MSDDWRDHPYYSSDPFPQVQPALLNSQDIADYASAGCLVASFDPHRLKAGSYAMRFLGKLYWWEREGDSLTRQEQSILPQAAYKLPKNSISYLFTEEEFRLPEYIAARFNLHIRLVHKGMLLGTGPLVHPGFAGSLLIPLHNLTNNDYFIQGGQEVIWIEFTKLSPLRRSKQDVSEDHIVP